MNKPRIDNPCPMLLSRMSKSGSNFYCSSCQKEIVDFRGKSNSEIKCLITSKTCGVFDSHQLEKEKEQTYYHKTVFFTLTVLSFLGFNVSPINAQTTSEIDTVIVDSSHVILNNPTPSIIDTGAATKKRIIKKNKRKRRRLFRRKRKKNSHRAIGTPKF